MKAIFIALFAFACFQVNGSHIVGGEFQMIHLSGTDYRITLIVYFDFQNGNPAAKDPFMDAKIFRTSDNAPMRDVRLPLVAESFIDTDNEKCGSKNILIAKLEYSIIISPEQTVFNEPGGYYIATGRCCRNYNITNIYSQDPQVGTSYAGQTFV